MSLEDNPMSLDVYLLNEKPVFVTAGTGVFVRQNGEQRELTIEELKERWPDAEVPPQCTYFTSEVFHRNITHNLATMADVADLYLYIWRPEEKGIQQAGELIWPLLEGLKYLKENPEECKKQNPLNGYGNYELLVDFVEAYLAACQKYPLAKVEVCR